MFDWNVFGVILSSGPNSVSLSHCTHNTRNTHNTRVELDNFNKMHLLILKWRFFVLLSPDIFRVYTQYMHFVETCDLYIKIVLFSLDSKVICQEITFSLPLLYNSFRYFVYGAKHLEKFL